MFFALLFLLLKSLIYLILFVIFISSLGITTGIRQTYVNSLIWLFEWTARRERDEAHGKELEDSQLFDNSSSSSIPSTSVESKQPLPTIESSFEYSAIIRRKWSQCIEQKLVEHVDQRNIHPLAQKVSRRVPSHGSGLQKLAKVSLENPSDAEYATMKVLVNDTLELLTAGIESIIEDEVTHRFEAAQLPTWNFLSRNRRALRRIGWRSQSIWVIGVIIRYAFLFPVRVVLFFISGAMISTLPAIIGSIPQKRVRKFLYRHAMLMCCRMAARTFSTIIHLHDIQNRPTHGICVANHTSPIDVMILSTDVCYSMVGQLQGGFLGMIQLALGRGSHHIWFERSETKDRNYVTKKLKEHVDYPNKMPILIFPEGTCINNTSVMLFKKGSFEISDVVYPIAMKYDNRLGDPFWNSHQQGYLAYLLSLMTAWALICDVYYLEPMQRMESENAIEFARRCQRAIARKGGLVDLGWDGNLKRAKVPERLKTEQKELFYQYLAQTTPICICGHPSSEQIESIEKEIHPEVFQQQQN